MGRKKSETRTVVFRDFMERDHAATVIEGDGDVLTIQVGESKPIKVRRSDTPAPFTWRPA